jgi:hypothetical protein
MHYFRFGFPGVMISDQGREFCNKLVDELLNLSGTDHRVTSAYHPQSNGMTGRPICACLCVFVIRQQNRFVPKLSRAFINPFALNFSGENISIIHICLEDNNHCPINSQVHCVLILEFVQFCWRLAKLYIFENLTLYLIRKCLIPFSQMPLWRPSWIFQNGALFILFVQYLGS